MRRWYLPGQDVTRRKELRETGDCLEAAAYNTGSRAVDCGNLKTVGQKFANILLTSANSEHSSRLHPVHEPATRRNQSQRIIKGKHTGKTPRHILANAVPDHYLRDDSPRLPQQRKPILNNE